MADSQNILFDTHTHLNFDGSLPDLDAKTLESGDSAKGFIDNAHKVGITYMLVPGTNVETSKKAIEIAETDSQIYAAVGIHPADVLEEDGAKLARQMKMLRELAMSSQKVVAIGEAGLDSYWIFKNIGGDRGQKEARAVALATQKEYFIGQWLLAQELKKACIIHCRQAKKPLLALLAEVWDDSFRNRVVFHCCEPDQDLLDFAMKHEIFIGVDGDITYNQAKQEFIRNIPLDRLVLETDAPFLTPEPVRLTKKFPNEPANLIYTAKYISGLLNISPEELSTQTTSNACQLFGISRA